jgi:exodeoxyribonuclease-3
MRIVAWNCNGGFHRKIGALMELRPDVAVISECAEPELLATRGDLPEMSSAPVWVGDDPNKGLGVFAFGDTELLLDDRFDPALRWIAPVAVRRGFCLNLLAVWADNSGRRKAVAGPMRESLGRYGDFLREQPALLAGDFNNNVFWDKPSWAMNHEIVVDMLADLGMVSGYHAHRREAQGDETEPTHYWRDRKKDGPTYHIDYIFLPEAWLPAMTAFEVGCFEDWCGNGLSDHVPLTIDLNF